ncbi:MAG: hypothetical protein K0R63_354 [Rickettsiales bacterium]|jgi:hypothetical protein|nr:hypothetical protein [Rickettsiales bacterium]
MAICIVWSHSEGRHADRRIFLENREIICKSARMRIDADTSFSPLFPNLSTVTEGESL